MSNQYTTDVTKLLKQTHPRLTTANQLAFKNCFGAMAGYVRGQIFISCGKFGVALKLPKKSLDQLFKEPDVKKLKYFSRGHVKK